jgi:hypothetical protein
VLHTVLHPQHIYNLTPRIHLSHQLCCTSTNSHSFSLPILISPSFPSMILPPFGWPPHLTHLSRTQLSRSFLSYPAPTCSHSPEQLLLLTSCTGVGGVSCKRTPWLGITPEVSDFKVLSYGPSCLRSELQYDRDKE